MTTWGARIEAGSLGYPEKGERPEYLANDHGPIRWYKPDQWQIFGNACDHNFATYIHHDDGETIAFQLPADH